MRRRLLGALTLALLMLIAAPAAAFAATSTIANTAPAPRPAGGTLQVPIVGSDGTNAIATITSFQVIDGVLTAVGTITGDVTTAAGTVGVTDAPFTAPVQDLAGSCDILTLDLGPLNLDLLGLIVDLSPIHLDITAQPGSGNLLGNLLCAVAGLLDNPGGGGGLLNAISNLLNQILGAL